MKLTRTEIIARAWWNNSEFANMLLQKYEDKQISLKEFAVCVYSSGFLDGSMEELQKQLKEMKENI